MFKKVVSVMLVLCLLALSAPAAFAENQETPQRTIEEILAEYHTKAFAAQSAEEGIAAAGSSGFGNGTAAVCANGAGNGTASLEQETVDALSAAGYEAYHVTASNYASLEDQMKTDFSQLGLDPDCSYIITIGGEEPGTATPPNSGVGTNIYKPPAYDDFGGDGGSTFTYSYNGTTYTMRHVLITSERDSRLTVLSKYNLSNVGNLPNPIKVVESTMLAILVDTLTQLPISTIRSMIMNVSTDEDYTVSDFNGLVLQASTAWTRDYLQIWDEESGMWLTAQYSSYAVSKARCVGYVYDNATNAPIWSTGVERSSTVYAAQYYNSPRRYEDAVWGYLRNQIYSDTTGDISFYFIDNNNIEIDGNHSPLFTHTEWSGFATLPSE